jgi:hypothetical protein
VSQSGQVHHHFINQGHIDVRTLVAGKDLGPNPIARFVARLAARRILLAFFAA